MRREEDGHQEDILVISHVWCEEKIADMVMLMSKARELAEAYGNSFFACIYAPENLDTERLCFCGAQKIYVIRMTEEQGLHTEQLIFLTKKIIDEIGPQIILYNASKLINDIAPRLAVAYETGLTADCIDFEICEKTRKLLQIRSAFEGDLLATIVCPEKIPQMATAKLNSGSVLPNAFDVRSKVEEINCAEGMSEGQPLIRLLSSVAKPHDEAGGDICIGVGRGVVFCEETMRLVRKLAGLLGAEIVGTRTAVEAGKLEYSAQVGLTGKTISPRIYIACGISGAVQHMMGIAHTDCLLAINQDAEAEIFKLCDYGIVGKAEEVLKMLLEGLEYT